jgi:hypothetical protein
MVKLFICSTIYFLLIKKSSIQFFSKKILFKFHFYQNFLFIYFLFLYILILILLVGSLNKWLIRKYEIRGIIMYVKIQKNLICRVFRNCCIRVTRWSYILNELNWIKNRSLFDKILKIFFLKHRIFLNNIFFQKIRYYRLLF